MQSIWAEKSGYSSIASRSGEAMTVSSRLALAVVVLVVVTSCVVSALACYFVAEAPPHGALTAVISAALAGGAVAAVLAIAVAVGFTNGLRKPPLGVAEV